MARSERLQAGRADRALPVLDCALARMPGSRDRPAPQVALADPDPGRIVLLVPTLQRPRFAHDLDVPLGAIAGLDPDRAALTDDAPATGRLVVLDRRAADDRAYGWLAVDRPTTVGDVTVTPLLADPDTGLWVLAVAPSGADAVDLGGCAASDRG